MNSFLVNEVNDIGGRPEQSEGVGFGKPPLFNTIYIYIFISIYIFVLDFKNLKNMPFTLCLCGYCPFVEKSKGHYKTDERPDKTDGRPIRTDERPDKTDGIGHSKTYKIIIKTLLVNDLCVLLGYKKRGVGRTPKNLNLMRYYI